MRLRLFTLMLVALPLLAAGVLLTRAVVNGERERAESEALRVALWRLDARATALVVGEASRAPEAYRSFWTPSEVFGERLTPAGRVLLPSPLLGLPQAPLHLHLRLAGGTLSSPQIPSGRERALALDGLIASSDLAEAERRLIALRSTLGREPEILLAGLPPPPDASDSIVNPLEAPRQAASPLAPVPTATMAAPQKSAEVVQDADKPIALRLADPAAADMRSSLAVGDPVDPLRYSQTPQPVNNRAANWKESGLVAPQPAQQLKGANDDFASRNENFQSSQVYVLNDSTNRAQKVNLQNSQPSADRARAPGTPTLAQAEQAPAASTLPAAHAREHVPVAADRAGSRPDGAASNETWSRSGPDSARRQAQAFAGKDESGPIAKSGPSREPMATAPALDAVAGAKPARTPAPTTAKVSPDKKPGRSEIAGKVAAPEVQPIQDPALAAAVSPSAPSAPPAVVRPAETGSSLSTGSIRAGSDAPASQPRLRPATAYPIPPAVAVSSPSTQASTAGLIEARWAGPQWLLLARRAKLDGHEELQAAALRWDDLRTQLTSRLTDLLPQAQLVPRRPDDPPERCLAALPIRLEPGPLPAVPLSSAARWTLGIAWGALLAGLAGGATLILAANRLAERRAAFVSAVTHELRTPLTALRLHADLLADPRVADDGARRGKRVEVLRAEAGRLAHLIDNVLDYARLERRRPPEPRPVALAELLAPLLPRLGTRLAAAGLELNTAQVPPCMVRCDPAAVERILVNLADNAAKYAASGTEKTITLSALLGKGSLELRLRDHGPGLAADVRARLFLPFARSAEAAAGNAPGVGLGLALCRRLARAQGGDLRLEEPDGGGVEAVLVLPLG